MKKSGNLLAPAHSGPEKGLGENAPGAMLGVRDGGKLLRGRENATRRPLVSRGA